MESKEVKQFMDFFKINLKSEKQLDKMSEQQQRQYACRLQRWDSLLETELMFECHKAQELFKDIEGHIKATTERIDDIKADPQFDDKENSFKKALTKVEIKTKEVVKDLVSDRQEFNAIYTPFRKMRKERLEQLVREELDAIKNGYKEEVFDDYEKDDHFSDDDIKEEDMSDIDIKEEDELSDVDIKPDINVKDEDLSDVDIKPTIKLEIKSEVKTEIKSEVKTEMKTEVKSEPLD